jgi:hypothetical protein
MIKNISFHKKSQHFNCPLQYMDDISMFWLPNIIIFIMLSSLISTVVAYIGWKLHGTAATRIYFSGIYWYFLINPHRF